ncbi:putative homeodomain transcription factor [Hypsibius exemplaris]|uniref:Homeodomain transcription factor n=1 Tax=Hypsibius exemplaris TaxID=2072580 RepID=A0A1W0XDU3_HYPEX|nr:putative homeodomain transcription factor [Hypsibius exemplaris]
MALEKFVQSYRRKLGSYDNKPWESALPDISLPQQSYEAATFVTARRQPKLKPELIDVDLVRGSTFAKEKSHSWTFFTRQSISRVVFLPFHSQWWIKQTAEPVYGLLIALYCLQIFALIILVLNLSADKEEWISASETLTPLLLTFIVSEILTQAERQDTLPGSVPGSFAPHAFESVSDDASIDMDDLASLSDGSCRSSSPGDSDREHGFSLGGARAFKFRYDVHGQLSNEAPRKSKRRPSRSNGYGKDEVVNWQAKNADLAGKKEEVNLKGKASAGFRPKRLSWNRSETTDSGLQDEEEDFQQTRPLPSRFLKRMEYERHLRLISAERPARGLVLLNDRWYTHAEIDAQADSDVSDMELSGWKTHRKAELDESTSDKEATDEEIRRLSPKRTSVDLLEEVASNPTEVRAPTDKDCLDFVPPTPTTSDTPSPDKRGSEAEEPTSGYNMWQQPIGCSLWSSRSLTYHKTDMSVYEITNCIVAEAEKNTVIGCSRLALAFLPVVFALLPVCHGIFRTFHASSVIGPQLKRTSLGGLLRMEGNWTDWGVVVFKANGIVQRYFWGFWFFLLLAVAFETYQQRYLVAKYFGYLTSSRRAKRANLPHFRLSKVRNVKSWLCVRSCLKKYGPRKSVDVVLSFSFVSCLLCVIFTCFMVVNAEDQFTTSIYVWESMLWLFAVGLFLLRFMVLGSKTNEKFRNFSVLTTEQLNLYLRMEQKPHKKDQLMLVNNVLKLAADLIKETEHPYKISGFPANPFLCNVSRLVILSALSTLISEICGIELKLLKLKM